MTHARTVSATVAGPRARARMGLNALRSRVRTSLAALRANPRAALLRILPWALLGALLLLSLITVIAQAPHYGVTLDEPLQQVYGERVLAWYRSRGQDTSFLTGSQPTLYMPEHGGIFDALIASIQSRLPGVDPWLIRHLMTGLTGWLGLVAIALCGYELGGAWVAFAAALGLWLYPRYEGAIFNNPKDIPAAMTMLFVLWATLLLLKYWPQRLRALEVGVILGLVLGAATAIRITAISWYAVLAVILAGWWVVNGRRIWRERGVIAALARQGALAGVTGVVWLLTTMALWPFIFLNPIANLVTSIQVLAHFPWPGTVLYGGRQILATQLPASYAPTWLVIGSPPATLALALLGVAMIVFEIVSRRRLDPAALVVALAFALPLASFIILRPTLYDSLRQFLYIVPPLILLAAYGLVRATHALWRRRQAAGRWAAVALVVVTGVSAALVAVEMVTLAPYEYTYFSPLVGGLRGAAGQYDTDYYGDCGKAATEWLAANYRHYTAAPAPTVSALNNLMLPIVVIYLPASLHETADEAVQPDFYVAMTRFNDNLRYPSYRVIHTVATEGVALCVVKANPATTSGP